MAALELGNVELFAGDIHQLDAATVGGPFDLAHTRFFLMHQPDPVRTLTQIARLLRPGGMVVAQEALRVPPPQSHPRLEALGAYWDLVYQVPEQAGGVPPGAATLLAARDRAVAAGIATGQQIDDLASELRGAKNGDYEWVSMPFFLGLTLRKPLAA